MAETLHDANPSLFIATRQGLLAAECDSRELDARPFALHGFHVTCLATDAKGVVLAAGLREGGLHSSRDGGKTWQAAPGLAGTTVVAVASSGKAVFAVAEPAALHVSEGGGATVRPLEGFASVWRERYKAAGDAAVTALLVRGQRLLVASSAGAIFLSEDGGNAFREVAGGLPAPVLCLHGPGGSADIVLAGTGAGLYRSGRPGSEPWKHVFSDPERAAVTAVGSDPLSGLPLVCGVAHALTLAKPGVPAGADAGLLRSPDGTSLVAAPVSRLPVVRGRVSRVVFAPRDPARVFAGTTAGEILESRDGGQTFRLVAATLAGVLDLAAGPALY